MMTSIRCAVRRGAMATLTMTFCAPLLGTATRPISATLTSAFVVLWLGSLLGEAGFFAFALEMRCKSSRKSCH
jgi:hypothetical protein